MSEVYENAGCGDEMLMLAHNTTQDECHTVVLELKSLCKASQKALDFLWRWLDGKEPFGVAMSHPLDLVDIDKHSGRLVELPRALALSESWVMLFADELRDLDILPWT